MNISLKKFDCVTVRTHLRHSIKSLRNEITHIRRTHAGNITEAIELVNAKVETISMLEMLYTHARD